MDTQKIGRTKRAKMTFASFGSVSTGTLLTDDLAESFLWELKHYHHPKYKALQAEWDRIGETENDEEREELESEFVNEDLTDVMSDLCKPYMYFGTLEGDGADFGFWLDWGSLQESDALRVSDLSEVPTGYTGEVIHVNDHGNTSLYSCVRGRLREIWAVV